MRSKVKSTILIKSYLSLALILLEDVIMGLDQVCSASESFPEIKSYLEYFKEIWLGVTGGLGLNRGFIFPFCSLHPHDMGSRSLAFPEIYFDYLGMGN